MKTRRSWRNQQRLWKLLGGTQQKPAKIARTKLPTKADVAAARWKVQP